MINKKDLMIGETYKHEFLGFVTYTTECDQLEQRGEFNEYTSYFLESKSKELVLLSLYLIN